LAEDLNLQSSRITKRKADVTGKVMESIGVFVCKFGGEGERVLGVERNLNN